MVNAFPASRKSEVQAMLGESLSMLVSQRLVPHVDGTSRKAAVEILVNTPASAAVIRSGQSHKLNSVIQSGGKVGMQSLDSVLKQLVTRGEISPQDAYENALDPSPFERMIARQEAA